MELKDLIKDLIESGNFENESLAISLLEADDISDEERASAISDFVERVRASKYEGSNEKSIELVKAWQGVYNKISPEFIKTRIKKVE